MEASKQDQAHSLFHPSPQNGTTSIQDPGLFAFLESNEEKRHPREPSFFSDNGLGQDVIQVTQAEPDVCLEVFDALYNTLWPQIESQSDVSLKDAWTRFIGGAVFKGSLCPPEKLITERRVRDIKRSLSESEGEARFFHDMDQIVDAILNLKQKIDDSPREILYKKEVIASLTLSQDFYQSFRNKVKGLVQTILEKEQNSASYVSELEALEDLLEPKAVMMGDIFAYHWAYRIPRNQAQKLLSLDMHGRNLKNNLNDPSNHRVIALPEKEPLVFFKANGNPPIQPEKEFMLCSLYRYLQIPVPETTLLILTNVFLENPEYFYAVQASEAVIGESPLKAIGNPETIFDHEAYVSQTIGAFLTNPSDGSFKNFKYSPEYKTLISIDNDLVFKPELTGKDEKKIVNVKSVLYLLPQIDLPIPESVQTFFSTLDPHLMIFTWLQDLSQKNREFHLLFTKLAFQKARCIYQNLLPQSEVPPLSKCLQQKVQVDPDLHSDSFKPEILVSQHMLNNLIEKFQALEKILSKNRSVSTQIIFEEISSALGKYYRKLRSEFSDIEEALEALWGNKKNDIDYSYISSLLDQEEILSSSKNEFDENIIPQTFIKEYKDILLSSTPSPLDGYIRRQNQRKKKNSLHLQLALKELRFLILEDLIYSQSSRDIVDFCHSLSKAIDSNPLVLKEVISLLSNLPHPELQWLFALEKYFLRPDRHIPKDLITSSVEVLGALMKNRTFILTESENRYLFDQHGNIKKNANLTGRSAVMSFPDKDPQFYLKQYPEWPGYEFASTLFMRLLGVTHLPYQDLVIINSKYPALLTQKVHGDPVFRIWHNSQALHNLDPFHTTLLIISAMLINPEDGKEDNFILSEDKKCLIPIDNDHCFLPSTFQKEGTFWNAFTVNTALQTKTILFCLDEMYMPIPNKVRKHILSLDFDLLLTHWMNELDKIENKINNLVDQQQRNQFLEKGTVMRIPFYKQFIESMHWKAHKIQDILKVASPELIPFDLLKTVEPFAARCYQDSFKQGKNLQTRFKAATNNLYKKTAVDGSRVSILNTRAMMEIINVSEKDLQDDAMFQRMGPVDSLELLNQLIQERIQKTQKEQEMLCELDEKKQEKSWISLFGNPPGEAALRDFFADPKEGLVLKGSKLITTSKLTELFAQTPNKGMRIRFLSLPGSPLLTSEEIKILAEECPNIEYLNISGCEKLQKIITAEGEWPLLARLEGRDCLNLKKFVSYSPMKILRIGTDQEIEIYVEKPTLDIFTISKKTIEFEFSFKIGEKCEIKSQNRILSNHNYLLCLMNGKEAIEKYFKNWKIIMKMPENILRSFLTFLDLKNSKITAQGIQRIVHLNLINLMKLDLSKNKMGIESLEYLIQGYWQKINHLDLSENEIQDEGIEILSRGNWHFLETLNLSCTGMTAFGVKAIVHQATLTKLKHLNLSYNKIGGEGLEVLSQANWPLLETLNLYDSGISKPKLLHFVLNATKWPNLEEVSDSIQKNVVYKDLLPKNWHLLERLNLSKSEITQNEIEAIVKNCNWPQLKDLDLSENKIGDEGLEILSQGDWPLLETLTLNYSNISKKRFLHWILNTKWSNLKDVSFNSIGKNTAKNLLRRNWHLLEELDLRRSEITQNEIGVIVKNCNWPQLKDLDLSENKIGDEELEILSQGNWPLLERLFLTKISMSVTGIQAIVNRANWTHLKCLYLSKNKIGDEGLEIFLQGNWPFLEILSLSKTNITAVGVEILASQAKWPKLKSLDLSENEIKDQGLHNLTQGNWPLLERLFLTKIPMSVTGIQAIVNKQNWPELRHLDLSHNKINNEIFAVLCQGNWPLLQTLKLQGAELTKEAFLGSLLNANWPNCESIDHLGDLNYARDSPDDWSYAYRQMMERFIKKDLSQLEGLDLNSFQKTLAEIEPAIKKNRSRCPRLKHLKICENDLSFEENISVLVKTECPLLEELHLENTKLSLKGVEAIVNQSKWRNLKYLNVSNNEMLDEVTSVFAFGSWPLLENLNLRNTKLSAKGVKAIVNQSKWQQLKFLDVSNNEIFDEGLSGLALADWPYIEEINLKNTKITSQGIKIFLKEMKLPYMKKLDISQNTVFDEGLKKKFAFDGWPFFQHQVYSEGSEDRVISEEHPSQAEQYLLVTVFDINWLGSKQIHLSRSSDSLDENIFMMPRAKWNQIESLKLSSNESKQPQSIVWPLNSKVFDLTNKRIVDQNELENSFFEECPLLENPIIITKEEITSVLIKLDWSYLKKLDVSLSPICDEGFEILASATWPLLEDLNLKKTSITIKSIEILVSNKYNWPNLKGINVSHNPIQDKGLEIIVSSNWDQLEYIYLEKTGITNKGIEIMISKSFWPNLKGLSLSMNEIGNEGLEKLSSGKWPLLENLYLRETNITNKGIESLVNISEWNNLKILDLSDNFSFQSVSIFRSGEKWPLLECLNLNNTDFTPMEQMSSITFLRSWHSLKEIHFQVDSSERFIINHLSMVSEHLKVKVIIS